MWNKIKVSIMKTCLDQKYNQDPFKSLLISKASPSPTDIPRGTDHPMKINEFFTVVQNSSSLRKSS